MAYSWSTGNDGYRASFAVSLPVYAMIYTSEYSMLQYADFAHLKSKFTAFGDLSSANVIVAGCDEHYILAGAVTAFRSQTIFRAVREHRRITRIEMWQPEIREGWEPEETVILEGSDWRELLVQYAKIAAEKMGVPEIRAEKNFTGYCTWYYYYKDVSEQHMLENIEALAANRSPYAAEYVQIDDGYQTFQGDWLDQHESWPTPLPEIADKIIRSGMKAGIWLMPTTASTASRVYREHPDWFVKNENGETATLPGWSPKPDHIWACLDATVPEAREHIANVFKTFRSWGFTYFKLDGLYFGLQAGIRRDPEATSVSAYRLLLETIRKAVPDAVIMACSEPFLPSVGLVDHARVSNDTSRYFLPENEPEQSIRQCGCSILDSFNVSMSNFWMFDTWFRCDPDVVMARQDNAFYTRNEAKISVLAAIMAGIAMTSDHLGTISPARNELLAKAQDIRMRNARPFLCKPNVWPYLFEGTIDGKRAVAAVNTGNSVKVLSTEELGLPPACIDLLDGKKLNGELCLAPHDAVLLIAE